MESRPTPPVAALRPETDAARDALGDRDVVRITRVPFNAGRESRSTTFENNFDPDRRVGRAPGVNDLYLVDRAAESLQISREHFRIIWHDGRFVLVDRGSTCGTIVAGQTVGRDANALEVELRDGDLIVVGTDRSPYVFRFQIECDQGKSSATSIA